MKKLFALFVLCLAPLSTVARNHFSYSTEIAAGAGIGRGPLALVASQFVVQYELGGSFKLGAGAGSRFAMPQCQYTIIDNGAPSRAFSIELAAPVFLRLGYGMEKLYVNVDAGYAFDLISRFSCYNGFFAEPHIGWVLNQHRSLALGVLLQQSEVMKKQVITNTITSGSTPSSISNTVTKQHLFTPAITLRYAFLF